MRPILIAILLIINALSATCQQAKAYMNADAYRRGDSLIIKDLLIKGRALEDSGEYSYWMFTKDYRQNKQIQQSVWAIERNDSLFLNCNVVFNTNVFRPGTYTYVYFKSDVFLHFRSHRVNDPSLSRGFRMFHSSGNPAFTIRPSTNIPDRFNYIYDFDQKKLIMLDRKLIKEYIAALNTAEYGPSVKYLHRLLAL